MSILLNPGLTGFTAVRYSVTKNGIPSNNRFPYHSQGQSHMRKYVQYPCAIFFSCLQEVDLRRCCFTGTPYIWKGLVSKKGHLNVESEHLLTYENIFASLTPYLKSLKCQNATSSCGEKSHKGLQDKLCYVLQLAASLILVSYLTSSYTLKTDMLLRKVGWLSPSYTALCPKSYNAS
jgi:hypothetical protein